MKSDAFKRRNVTDYLAIFNNNVDVIYEDYMSAHIDLIKSAVNIVIFASALLIFVDWRITLVVFILSLITAFLPRLTMSRLSKKRKHQLSALSQYFGSILDLLNGKKRINVFTVNFFNGQHLNQLNKAEEASFDYGKTKTISDLINAIGVFMIQLCTFITVALLLLNKQISVGVGIAAFGYVTSFLDPIRNILQC